MRAGRRQLDGAPAAFAFTLKPNGATGLPYYPLRDYRLTWQLLGAENRAFANGAAAIEGAQAGVRRAPPCPRAKTRTPSAW